MAQFDFYQYKKRGKPELFLVNVQSDLLDDMNTRIVIPIRPLAPGQKPISILQPTIEWPLGTYYFSTSEIAAISTTELKGLGKNKSPISLVSSPVCCVPERLTYNEYARLSAPCRQTNILRDMCNLFFPRP